MKNIGKLLIALLLTGTIACAKPHVVPDISVCAAAKSRPQMIVTSDETVLISLIDLIVYSESLESRLTCIENALGGK